MIESDVRGIETIVRRLLASPEPISFLDAVMVIRHVRKTGDPFEREVQSLIHLHDAPHTTDGAREVLADFLSGWARKQELERLLGGRVIIARDTGKKARVSEGTTVVLEFTERRGKGYRWEVERCEGPGRCTRDARSDETPSTAVFLLVCESPGQVYLTLRESPGKGSPLPAGDPFDLVIAVEALARQSDTT